MSFSTLGLLPQLLDAIKAQGYSEATPIQEKSIPIILEGKDLMAALKLAQERLQVLRCQYYKSFQMVKDHHQITLAL